MRKRFLLLPLALAATTAAAFQAPTSAPKVPSFPGAEGPGAITPGGRGGKVLEVTNLNDSGPGSLRAALEESGPRIVVFRVAGIISLQSRLTIKEPFITIAGQTAPGDGICVRGETTEINTHDVIIRYMRFRRGELTRRDDALGGYPTRNVIVDHCSASWGLDENLSLYRWIEKMPDGKDKKRPVENLTIQWCISSEALDLNKHAFGGTVGGRNASLHHNLFASNTGRNPSIGYGDHVDFRNNVLFNWQHRTVDGGDASSWVNVVANYYKPGPATGEGDIRYRVCRPQHLEMFSEASTPGKWHVSDNFVVGNTEVTADNWQGGVQFDDPDIKRLGDAKTVAEKVRNMQPFASSTITQQTAQEAYELVLLNAGAILPRRDPVDERIVEAVRTGKTTVGRNGIIDRPQEAGGWPEYRAAVAIVDSDHDGMPDDWEQSHRLNPKDATDGAKDTDNDGYTNIEEYLNGTDPNQFVDYTQPQNNKNPFHRMR